MAERDVAKTPGMLLVLYLPHPECLQLIEVSPNEQISGVVWSAQHLHMADGVDRKSSVLVLNVGAWQAVREGNGAQLLPPGWDLSSAITLYEQSPLGSCTSCKHRPDHVNHVKGHVFVGWGMGWQICPTCNGSTRAPGATK